MVDEIKIEGNRGVLIFKRDLNDKNWVSRLSNGKWVLLHRSCKEIPQEGVEYECMIQEKEAYALAWILGVAHYPRIVIKPDETCIMIFDPKENKKPQNYEHVYDAFRLHPELEYLFLIYRKENKSLEVAREDLKSDKFKRKINIDFKLKDSDTNDILKFNVDLLQSRILSLKDISDRINEAIRKLD